MLWHDKTQSERTRLDNQPKKQYHAVKNERSGAQTRSEVKTSEKHLRVTQVSLCQQRYPLPDVYIQQK